MMKQKYYIHVIVCGLAALQLTGCTDELDKEQMPANGHGISFSASVKNGWDEPADVTRSAYSSSISEPVQMKGGKQTLYLQAEVLDGITMRKTYQTVEDTLGITRGAVRTASNMYDAIGVMGYSFSGSWDGTQTPDFMYNLKAAKGTSVYETTKDWPSSASTNLRFYAYAPHSEDAEGITPSTASVAGVPQLTYEVPADVTKQSDLLATLCDETASAPHTSPQAIEFHHLLTAVCFKIGDGMAAGTINKITLKNIKHTGTYTFPSATPWATDKGSWAVDSDVKDFVYTPSPAFNTDGTANVQINTGENVLMMLPQTLSDDAAVEVEFTAAGESTPEKYSANIKGVTSWEQGKTVTYAISLDPNATKYILTASLNKSTYSCEGEDGTLTITSYKETAGVKEALAWTITAFSIDGGTTWRESPSTNLKDNEVIDFADVTGTGGEVAQDQAFSVYNTNYETTVPKSDALTNATPAVDVDLSLYDVEGNSINRSTANCYVVRAPGTYKFPVVYGNGIKNGVETDEGYKSKVDPDTIGTFTYPTYSVYKANGDLWYTNEEHNQVTPETKKKYTLFNFPNSYGDAITSSWIHKNSHAGSPLTPTTAELVWTDAKNLIRTENVGLTQSGDEYYVNFEIKKDDIVEGNALIQVKGADNTVLWSWHIWVTNADFSQTTTITATSRSSVLTPPTVDKDYTFMSVPLGCIDEVEAPYTYEAREVMIRVKQSESEKVAVVRLRQPEQVINDRIIYVTNYQWGRKDPFPYKDVDGLVKQTQGAVGERATICDAIQHPNTFYVNSSSGNISSWYRSNGEDIDNTTQGAEGIFNLWDINMVFTGYHVEYYHLPYALQYVSKSIYDPCPVGYHVADSWAFTGFCNHPANSYPGLATYQLGVGNTYHTKYRGADVDLFIPVTNIRRGTIGGAAVLATNCLYYWTATYDIPTIAGGVMYFAHSYERWTRLQSWNAVEGNAVYPIKDYENPITYGPTVNPWDDSQGEITLPMSN